MDRRLFLDFDGTLVDSRQRQHALFIELSGASELDLDLYWREKRAGKKQADMLNEYCALTAPQMAQFKHDWMAQIEAPERLASDTLIAGVAAFLEQAARHFSLHLVTGRQHREHLLEQMRRLGIDGFFSTILNTAQQCSKTMLVSATEGFQKNHADVFIGDTGEDILAGKELGAYTVGVASGATDANRLKKYAPDLIVESVAALLPSTLGVR